MENKIIQGDCLGIMKEMEDNSIDAVITDPPYGLSFMGKKWDYDVPSQEIWEECLRVLKPGGYLLAFAGTRTQHRMAVRIEDAGFEIRDMIAWVYGSGFPKSLNIGKSVDKLQGNEREILNEGKATGVDGSFTSMNPSKKGFNSAGFKWGFKDKGTSEWEGWGTALKPALEPITVARKPLSEKTVAENCLKWGVGGINIDECRIPANWKEERPESWFNSGTSKGGSTYGGNLKTITDTTVGDRLNEGGRFPSNLITDGSDEVVSLFPQANHKTGSSKGAGFQDKFVGGEAKGGIELPRYNDSGSAARFFYCAKSSRSERNKGLDSIVSIMINYTICDTNGTQKENKVQLLVDMDSSQQKVIGVSGTETKNATEWNTMLFGNCTLEKFQEVNKFTTGTKTNLITTSTIWNWLNHLLTNEYTAVVKSEMENGGNLVENVEKSNTLITTINEKMVSALGVNNVVSGMQLKISVKEGNNFHSTVKPIALMEYLVKLVSREGAVVLDPFAGSGSTLLACKKLGRNYIGIELDPEYIKIAEARLKDINNTLF